MKHNYFYSLTICSLCIVLPSLISCTNKPHSDLNESGQLQYNKIHDSLVATGKHGYNATVFIVGRIKSTPLFKGNPFEIKVLKITPELLGEKINFKILDSENYTIAYTKNRERITLKGVFDQKLEDVNIQLILSKAGSFSDSTTLSALKSIDYLFEVDAY